LRRNASPFLDNFIADFRHALSIRGPMLTVGGISLSSSNPSSPASHPGMQEVSII
jgi:hypothetical protein